MFAIIVVFQSLKDLNTITKCLTLLTPCVNDNITFQITKIRNSLSCQLLLCLKVVLLYQKVINLWTIKLLHLPVKLAVYSYTEVKSSEVEQSVYQPTSDRQTMASSIMKTITNLVAGSDDDKQTIRQTPNAWVLAVGVK